MVVVVRCHGRARARARAHGHGHCRYSCGGGRNCGCGCGCGRDCGRRIVIAIMSQWWFWGGRSDINLNFFLLALDPRLKLFYYEEHDWEKQYIDKAKETVSQIYHSQYAPIGTVHQKADEEEDDLIAHIYKRWQNEGDDEFELYLKAPRAPRKADGLQWWKVSSSICLFIFIKNLNSLPPTGS